MKLEYVREGAPECPLIRLFDFTVEEVEQLREIINQLALGKRQRIEIHNLSWIESIGNCRLTFFMQSWDQGVVKKKGNDENNFECGFTTATWDNIEGLVEPFINGSGGFQWLASVPGETDILLSRDGQW